MSTPPRTDLGLPPPPSPPLSPPPSGRAARAYITATPSRRPPSASGIARRRVAVLATKVLLPLIAVTLLVTIAIWPELDRASETARIAFRRLSGAVEGATMLDARYRGTDERGRPYTVTATSARQGSGERVALTEPKGDMRMENGGWMFIEAREGVFLQKSNQVDLAREVLLYRDDGMTLRTESLAVDMRAGAAAGSQPVQVEGPLGNLQAAGMVLLDKGAVIQFTGPAQMVVNGAER